MPYIAEPLKRNPAVFPDPAQPRRLEMLHDHDRATRRLTHRPWTEIKVR